MPQGRHPRQTARVDQVAIRGEKVDVQLDVPDLRVSRLRLWSWSSRSEGFVSGDESKMMRGAICEDCSGVEGGRRGEGMGCDRRPSR